jgi:hypothetical protein
MNLFCRIVAACGLGAAALAASSQSRPPTTEQLGRDPGALRQEAEQQRSQERAQQQQSSQQQADQQWNDTVRQQQGRAAADTAQGQAVLRTWQQRPPLAPERNPLLGRWESLGVGKRAAAPGVSPEMANLAAALLGGITGGLCDSMLGRGTVEFRPAGVVSIGADGRERPMYRAQYRGGGARVVVLPQGGTTFTHMIIDFNGPDRASVAAVGCSLARSGGSARMATASTTAAANTSSAGDAAAPSQWALLGTTGANGGMDIYVARATIRRSGASAQMSDLWDFKTPHVFEGKPLLSTRNQYEYDCVTSRRRMLSTTGYSGHMGQGAVVGSGNSVAAWEEIATTGPIRDYWKVACTRQ